MIVYLNNKSNSYSAEGIYEPNAKIFIVKAGAVVSREISCSSTFHGRRKIEKLRDMYVVNGVTVEDVYFKSPSTAANFITGISSNGMMVWKTSEGLSIKQICK